MRFNQVTFCPTFTSRVGGANLPLPPGYMTTRALFNLKSRDEFVLPVAVLAVISTGRIDEFTVGATEIPKTIASWVPMKVNSLGFIINVTPGIVDAAERMTWLLVIWNWLIVIV